LGASTPSQAGWHDWPQVVRKPRLAISSGDPAGIGPEVTLKALAQSSLNEIAELYAVGDPAHLARVADSLGMPAAERIEPAGDASGIELGRVGGAAGRAAVAAVTAAVEMVRSGRADGIVTAPINKEALRAAGYPWPGHTELLASLAGVSDVRMLLVRGNLRVVHVTTHRSLRSAIEAATADRILKTIQVADESGQLLGLTRRRIGVAGVNPHAGENGLFGREEADHVQPAIDSAVELGLNAIGPIPADTLFWRAQRGEFDLQVAMYHDQGHIPIKLGGFEDGVNISLGLPFLRTSVDHGTAFDIAGKGVAEWRSMAVAIQVAVDILRRQWGTPATIGVTIPRLAG
jgi:4-hydroxythreonine-4-phosphate dehydrogenase